MQVCVGFEEDVDTANNLIHDVDKLSSSKHKLLSSLRIACNTITTVIITKAKQLQHLIDQTMEKKMCGFNLFQSFFRGVFSFPKPAPPKKTPYVVFAMLFPFLCI